MQTDAVAWAIGSLPSGHSCLFAGVDTVASGAGRFREGGRTPLHTAKRNHGVDRRNSALIFSCDGGTRHAEDCVDQCLMLRCPISRLFLRPDHIHRLSSELPFAVDHRLLILILLQVFPDYVPALPLFLVLQLSEGVPILFICAIVLLQV